MFTCQGRKSFPSTMRHKYRHRRSLKPSACCCGDVGLKKTDVCETISSVPWDPTVLQESHVGTLTQLETVQFWIAKDVVCSPLPSLQTERKGKRLVPAWCWWKAHFSWSGGISELQLMVIMSQIQHLIFTIAPRCSEQVELSLNLVKEMQSWNPQKFRLSDNLFL